MKMLSLAIGVLVLVGMCAYIAISGLEAAREAVLDVRVEEDLVAKRDAVLKAADELLDLEALQSIYKAQHNGELPAVQYVEQVQAAAKRDVLKNAANYSHLLGLNASLQSDHRKAVAFFEEAAMYDPSNPTYTQAAATARALAQQQ